MLELEVLALALTFLFNLSSTPFPCRIPTMKLAIVGAGKMGEAILEGILNAGLVQTSEVGLIGRDNKRMNEVAERHGVTDPPVGDAGDAEAGSVDGLAERASGSGASLRGGRAG